jgi:hypothetical protein
MPNVSHLTLEVVLVDSNVRSNAFPTRSISPCVDEKSYSADPSLMYTRKMSFKVISPHEATVTERAMQISDWLVYSFDVPHQICAQSEG